jgi:threonine dehydrogenase-like Zn-dependent dehydrogenase
MNDERRDDPLLMQWLHQERIRVPPLITHRLLWRDAIRGYEGLRDRPDEYVGVILQFESQKHL